MTTLRNYKFELCWLVLVVLLYALTPARTSAFAFAEEEEACDCPAWSGWCPMAF